MESWTYGWGPIFGPFLTWKKRISKIFIFKGGCLLVVHFYKEKIQISNICISKGLPYTQVLKTVPFAVFQDAIWSHMEWAQGLQFDLILQVWHNKWCNPLLSTERMDVCRGWVSPQVRDGANQFDLYSQVGTPWSVFPRDADRAHVLLR